MIKSQQAKKVSSRMVSILFKILVTQDVREAKIACIISTIYSLYKIKYF